MTAPAALDRLQPAVPSLAEHAGVREVLDRSTVFTEVVHLAEVGSTNDVARTQLQAGTPPGLVVVADRQTAGRGRAGRSWTDDLQGPAGPANLAVTATVTLPEHAAGLVPLVAGLAVADAYAAAGADPRLKWPNDALLEGRKAAGILVERHTIAERDVLLIGCGLDLDWRGIARTGAAAGWISVAESLGAPVDRGHVLSALLAALADHLDVLAQDPGRVLSAYRDRCGTLGQEVDISLPNDHHVIGTAVAIDDDGRLVVDTGRERVAVLVGDVTHVRPAAP